ncbi:hypothetical protein BO70DRAFT_137400 [Aspergillus heteromorphus CBS 117.55]|uniref:BRCT domain-containing protein n=1 Tax=Aspergillus heteromorphus CBS 117.55 TaxID=1448321 RepID=A0A317VAM0_9EURO|nr:uncharacterized protein BO70DRAFT_137400 [Aspergillus heteromorphus CBS 117.55]PWY70409.1 hypothetical protein BO70DRAFT_137400 [Aspergillus heteromorphus CBS 117.55]
MPTNPQITPTNHLTFDVWNTSATGHQVADSARGSAWRDTRRQKLTRQFGSRDGDCTSISVLGGNRTGTGIKSGGNGGEEGSRGEWVFESPSLPSSSSSSSSSSFSLLSGRRPMMGIGNANANVGRDDGQQRKQRDIRSMFGQVRKRETNEAFGSLGEEGKMGKRMRVESQAVAAAAASSGASCLPMSTIESPTSTSTATATAPVTSASIPTPAATSTSTSTSTPADSHPNPHPHPTSSISPSSSPPQILTNLTIHINGQTTPHISDHKLKRLLVAHGASLAIALNRKVTHLVVGQPNSGPGRGGAGGGLAAGKLQKEIQRAGWKGIKLVRVQWVLDSIAAGKRLSEAKYAAHLVPNQKSVFGLMKATANGTAPTTTPTTTPAS